MDRVFRVDHIPGHDEKVLAESLKEAPGGQGLWAARALASWRAPVTFVTRAGDDDAGRWLAAALAKIDGLVVRLELKPDARTETCIILVDGSGEKALVLAPTDADMLADLGASLAPASGDVVTANLFHPGLHGVFQRARAAGASTILDLEAPALGAWGLETVLAVLGETGAVCTNASTLAAWSEQDGAKGDVLARAYAMAAFLGRRAARVCVTLGAGGVLAWEAGRAFHLPAEAITVRDSTGAGDTFLAGLAFATLHRWSFEDAVRFASAAAADFLVDGHGPLARVEARRRRVGAPASEIPRPNISLGPTRA